MTLEQRVRPRAADVFTSRALIPATGHGVLDGWDVAVKDNIDVAGLPTTGGTRFLSDNVATADAKVVASLRAAGATIVGKTNLHELGHGITGVNPTFGTTLHPENPDYTVGGSSGGSALAVMLRYARVALGTDTGGSARIPAAYTGLVGFRPSTGRYPASGVIRISPSRDTVGVLGRSVADVALVDRVLGSVPAAPSPSAASQSPVLGVLEEACEWLTPARRALFEEAMSRIAATGVEVMLLSEQRELDRCFELGIVVLAYETIPAIKDYLGAAHGADAVQALIEVSESPDTREILRAALDEPVSPDEYRSARAELAAMHERFVSALGRSRVTTLVYPTTTGEPPKALTLSQDEAEAQLRAVVLNSTPATLFATPAISLPAGVSEETGIAAGITLERAAGDDADLLRDATLVEEILAGDRLG
ncbi:amidase [Ruicaihuangia caeni]|uniref:Amidase family protein n=1 Tax=Ruicaihuangia caeni TaxID=3042517 RepID=A0AAW6T3M3_9MICO|nr:amidase family protein [Klugiella sp. YN-L-19]MDI2098435.1 amidase family protein [Klugiella sp. YN-L-19]